MGRHLGDDICLLNSATTHTILKNQKFSSELSENFSAKVSTIAGSANIIDGPERAHIILPNGTHIFIQNALYSSNSKRNLQSFKDIRMNGYNIETINENNKEYLCVISIIESQKLILEKFDTISTGLYFTKIGIVESHSIYMSQKPTNTKTLILWHDRLGHPESTMMRKIAKNSNGHDLSNQLNLPSDYLCAPCAQEKLIT